MLAQKRKLCFNDNDIEIRTPLLVPAFSSKGIPEIQKIMKTMEEFITVPILVSAYDIYYKKISSTPINFPDMVFLDSGGYEAPKDVKFHASYKNSHKAKPWKKEFYKSVLSKWNPEVPTVVVSYDHPSHRYSLSDQIKHANRLFNRLYRNRDGWLTEILIKPETKKQRCVKIDNVIGSIKALSEFDVLGFTEKELGGSVLEIMINIAKIRRALDEADLNCPIHIFGSLDTITTPLYFLSGADIFDGLSWLRFGYHEGKTLYFNTFSPLCQSINRHRDNAPAFMWPGNISYLDQLTLEMRNYLNKGEFSAFNYNSKFFQQSYESLLEALKED